MPRAQAVVTGTCGNAGGWPRRISYRVGKDFRARTPRLPLHPRSPRRPDRRCVGENVLGALRLPPPAVSLRIACPPAVLSVVVRHVARLLSPARSPFMRGRASPIDATLKLKSDADAAHDPIPSQVSLSGQEEFSALDHHMKREARRSVRYRPILSAGWRLPTPLAQWLPRFHSELRKCAVSTQ
jgi:hypothetical protein